MPKKKKFERNHAVTIRIVRKPDQRRVKKASQGRTTNLGVCQFIANLLEANEKLNKSQKLTDETIKDVLFKEFPQSKIVQGIMNGTRTMGYYRSLYNIGHFTNGKKPYPKSYRYTFEGERASHRGQSYVNVYQRKAYAKRIKKQREYQREYRKRKRGEWRSLEVEFNRYARKLVKAFNLMAWETYIELRNERLARQRAEKEARQERKLREFPNKKNTRQDAELRLDCAGSGTVGVVLKEKDRPVWWDRHTGDES